MAFASGGWNQVVRKTGALDNREKKRKIWEETNQLYVLSSLFFSILYN